MKVVPRDVMWEAVLWDGSEEAREEIAAALDAFSDWIEYPSYIPGVLRLYPTKEPVPSLVVATGQWVVVSSIGEVLVYNDEERKRRFK